MSRVKRILRMIIPPAAAVLLTCSGCASAKNDFLKRKQAESTCDLTRLGRNKYFYSKKYQAKLRKYKQEIKNK
ncbi:MAG TPA: hypothetical protein VMT63_07335 [Bacteroidales bacterium]|nr:hypothetical protein [Bacteroidales bacterium]